MIDRLLVLQSTIFLQIYRGSISVPRRSPTASRDVRRLNTQGNRNFNCLIRSTRGLSKPTGGRTVTPCSVAQMVPIQSDRDAPAYMHGGLGLVHSSRLAVAEIPIGDMGVIVGRKVRHFGPNHGTRHAACMCASNPMWSALIRATMTTLTAIFFCLQLFAGPEIMGDHSSVKYYLHFALKPIWHMSFVDRLI